MPPPAPFARIALLALAPLGPSVAPLDAGERFALDLLLDLSCVLRACESSDAGSAVPLRIESGTDGGAAVDVRALLAGRGLRVQDDAVILQRAVLRLVCDVAGQVAEQRSTARDRHGRVPSSENVLVAAGGGLERSPVVSSFARRIARAMRQAAGRRPAMCLAPWPRGHRWAAAFTHDLDVVDWWPAFTALRLAELASAGRVGDMYRVVRAALVSGGRDIVWRGVHGVLAAEAAHGIRSTWFILCGSPSIATARAGDLTYQPEGRRARGIIDALVAAGHEIGLHGSFATRDEPAQFSVQRHRLAALAGRPVSGVRQHYLRTFPDRTSASMSEAGFSYDSTAGFADRNGFRAGVADVLPAWSDPRRQPLPIAEAPFCWMDRALSKYQHVHDPAAWVDDALELAARCRAVQGMFAGIWHPNLSPALGFPGAPEQYARLVAGVVDGGAYVAPVADLVEWRRVRREVRAAGIRPDGSVELSSVHPEIVIEPADIAAADA